jgi:hypothetical protein
MAGLNGGSLRRGGGNPKRNGGRPPSVIREKLRGSFDKRVKVLEQIADGKLAASVADRLKAIDLLAKYGLGTTVTETDTEGNDAPRPGVLTPDERRAALIRELSN